MDYPPRSGRRRPLRGDRRSGRSEPTRDAAYARWIAGRQPVARQQAASGDPLRRRCAHPILSVNHIPGAAPPSRLSGQRMSPRPVAHPEGMIRPALLENAAGVTGQT